MEWFGPGTYYGSHYEGWCCMQHINHFFCTCAKTKQIRPTGWGPGCHTHCRCWSHSRRGPHGPNGPHSHRHRCPRPRSPRDGWMVWILLGVGTATLLSDHGPQNNSRATPFSSPHPLGEGNKTQFFLKGMAPFCAIYVCGSLKFIMFFKLKLISLRLRL